jgi:hypothetical protein
MRLFRLQIKVSEEELKLIDSKRGTLTRSAYIRLLIEKAKGIKIGLK